MAEKLTRKEELEILAKNIEIILNNNGHKFISFTSDATNYTVISLINELAEIFKNNNRKVGILSYTPVENKIQGIEYKDLDIIKNYNIENINEKASELDIILVDCPNPLVSKHYLHLAHFTKDAVIIAKKWKSKINNINNIKQIAKDNDLNLIGVIYEK